LRKVEPKRPLFCSTQPLGKVEPNYTQDFAPLNLWERLNQKDRYFAPLFKSGFSKVDKVDWIG